MKKTLFFSAFMLFISLLTFGQTNTFPVTGNAGVGTTGPLSRLHVRGSQNLSYGLFTLQDSTLTGDSARAYMTFYGGNYKRLGYMGFDSATKRFVINNEQSNVVSISPAIIYRPKIGGSGTDTLNPKLVVGSVPLTNDNGNALQIYGNTYLRDNVGIGTTAPAAGMRLDVKGAILSSNEFKDIGIFLSAGPGDTSKKYGLLQASNKAGTIGKTLILQNNGGRVGIGTDNVDTTNKLEIAGGNIALRGGNSFYFYAPAPFQNLFSQMYTDGNLNLSFKSGNGGVLFQSAGSTSTINFQTYSSTSNAYFDRLTILNNGNIGIGTSAPGSYKLAVEGTIGARKLTITKVTPWADYVFKPTYRLRTLEEVEAFIKKYNHLPDVPSAAQVEKDGIDVGSNQATLLRKIEELTLYVIDMKKQVDRQQVTMNEQKRTIQKQQLLLSKMQKGNSKNYK